MTAHRTALAHTAARTRRRRRRAAAVTTLALTPLAVAALGAGPVAHAAPAPLPGATVMSASPHAALSPKAATGVNAGSIVYLKNNNIWIMKGTGAGKRAVTTDGTAANPYRSPSQSDTGVVVAARGSLIVRMDQHGAVLNTIDPPYLVDSAGEHLDGAPTEVAISPNGRTIAYSFSWYSCPPALSCGVRQATGYTAATKLTPPSAHGTSFYGMPSWIGNTRTLQTGTTSTVEYQDIDSPSQHWFYDGDYTSPPADLTDGELSDDGRQLVMTRGYGSQIHILWYTVNGDARTGTPTTPSPNCWTSPTSNVGSPTFGPGGGALAYSYPQGIYVLASPATCGGGTDPKLVAAGGTHPDWSKAALQS